jgi:hypothetical protein
VHPNGVTDNVGNHPNGFFNSSVDYIKSVEKNKAKKAIAASQGGAGPVSATQTIEPSQVSGADVDMS